jgi:glycosyltransferase involved in cell wall biosynthesis
MPVYNGEAYLEQALDSVLAQHEEGIEIVAVDDGSTDRTLEILERFSSRMPLRVLSDGRTGNWVASTNRGMRDARGAFVCILHQDDMWLQGRMAALKHELRSDPTPALVLHASWYVDASGRRIGRWRCPLPAGFDLSSDYVIERLLVQNFVAAPATLFPRRLALDSGGMAEDLWYTADWDLWLRLAEEGRVRYISRPLSAFRVHDHAQTVTRSVDSGDFLRQHTVVLDRHLGSLNGNHDRSAVEHAARFSIQVNLALAALAHRQRPQLVSLGSLALRLGPAGWRRYFRDSRILERAGARVRAGIGRNGT